MPVKPQSRRVLITALIIALMLGGVWQVSRQFNFHPGNATRIAAVPTQGDWRIGQLRLRPCEIGSNTQATLSAYCSEFAVPENYAAGDGSAAGRRINLKVAVINSTAAQADDDWITFLDGGPGGAATEDFPALMTAFAPLLKHHHVLLIDQRGTGSSNPLVCPILVARYKSAAAVESALLADPKQAQQQLRECLTEIQSKAEPQYYTTIAAVHDLEAVRLALGIAKLNLVGVSYGTRVAQQYALHYPQAVRSLILDSAVPNSLALGQDHAQNLEAALQADFQQCTNNPECRRRFGNPYAHLQALRSRLQAAPITINVADPNTYQTSARSLAAERLITLVRLYAYNSATTALLPLMIDEALRGNYAPLLGQEQLLSDEVDSRITGGVGLSVGCSEDADLLQARDADRNTLLGNSLIEFFQSACLLWPHQARPGDFHQPFISVLPTLILAGELDPVTPPRYADEIAHTLVHARVLLAPHQGHGVMTVQCMPELLSKFIETLQPQSLDARCLQRLSATPAFLNYNGAAP